ncbi:DUF4394 domain-containing protein [Massilia sp. CCM 8733]|uniref:DUF4394 domain-containing protein n=1 Tax=Massilia mucilaginosa TaxID=2609282 RepID=A0ABX0P1W7_9BURK|nr:DUF4394 domain-containing protein [Massilia mucilaginosa]NHZ92805.1 DUF4394 domain-containing protein [Massilia mucilaginosa]
MHNVPFTKLLLASAIAMTLAACGSDDNHTPAPPPPPVVQPVVEAGDTVMLTASGRIVSLNADNTVRTNVALSGLQASETLLGIDFRPLDGLLYGVGSSGRIYTINPSTGAASMRSTLAADAADTSAPFTALAGGDYAVDFNPAADRLRVVSDSGQNLRINVESGATTTDGNINGGPAAAKITSAAYTNALAGTGSTTLFAIDAAGSTLYTQNPPNNGTLSMPVALGVTASAVGGFDIDARSNRGLALLTVGGKAGLYAINLSASANPATLVAALDLTDAVKGLAVRSPATPVVLGLTDGAHLVSFKPQTPAKFDTDVAITGMNSGEKLLGFDIRPKDGLLYGITSSARIVTIDANTGVATAKATLTADAADLTQPFSVIAGSQFAVDFNPVADRLRVIGNSGQSLRINVDTGATTTDGGINRAGAAPVVTAGAYTNSFAGTTATMLFVLDTASDNLALVNPPNDGTLSNIGALGVDAMGDGSMDIAGGANGLVLAALRSAGTGPTTLYRVDLATGAAVPFNGTANPANSVIGSGSAAVLDIAVVLK